MILLMAFLGVNVMNGSSVKCSDDFPDVSDLIMICISPDSLNSNQCFNASLGETMNVSISDSCKSCATTFLSGFTSGSILSSCFRTGDGEFDETLPMCGEDTLQLRYDFSKCWGSDPMNGMVSMDYTKGPVWKFLDERFKPFGPLFAWAIRAASDASVDLWKSLREFMVSKYRFQNDDTLFENTIKQLGNSNMCISSLFFSIRDSAGDLDMSCYGITGQNGNHPESHCDFSSGIYLDSKGISFPYCDRCLQNKKLRDGLVRFYACSGHSIDTSFVSEYTGPVEPTPIIVNENFTSKSPSLSKFSSGECILVFLWSFLFAIAV